MNTNNLVPDEGARPEGVATDGQTADSGEPGPDRDDGQTSAAETTASDQPDGQEIAGDDAGQSAAGEADTADIGDSENAETRKRKRRRQTAQQRIDQLTREKRALERTVARFGQSAPAGASADPPREEDFDTPAEFQVAVAKHAARAVAQETRQLDAQNASNETLDMRSQIFNARVDEALDRMPDFHQVFTGNVPVSQAMADIIAESDKGPELAYHLGKNLLEADRIAGLPPIQAARALGQLEASLTRTGTRKRSNAPPPVKTVGGQSDAVQPALDALSYEQYRERRGFAPKVN